MEPISFNQCATIKPLFAQIRSILLYFIFPFDKAFGFFSPQLQKEWHYVNAKSFSLQRSSYQSQEIPLRHSEESATFVDGGVYTLFTEPNPNSCEFQNSPKIILNPYVVCYK
jgi:hypothetical protein